MTIVWMRDIVKRYGGHLALDHVDLEIQKGEIIGLLGPNGAGKTTLIHTLAGLIEMDSGTIEIFGQPQGRQQHQIKRRIGLVTQEVTIFDDLTARENLAFFGGIYGLKGRELKQRIGETLEFVGLASRADSLPARFSGGMRRRLNIACALIHTPELLIMDEPTVGIDPQSRHHILESVRKLRDSGTTILYCTHYMEEVQALASRAVIIDQGHVIAEGTVEELVKTIKHEERIRLEVVEWSEEMICKIRELDGVKQVLREGNKLHILSRPEAGVLDRVLSIARSAGGVRSVHAEEPTLEDVFLTLTGKHLRDGEEE